MIAASRKRSLGTGSFHGNSGMDSLVFLSTVYRITQPVVSPIISISCEISNSSLSESDTVSSFGTTYQSPKNVTRKRKRFDQYENAFLRQGTRAMGLTLAAEQKEHPRSNVWDDSSWILLPHPEDKKAKNEGTPSTINGSTIRTSTSRTCSRSKHSKVQGLLFAESLDFESTVWEDTHWQLPTVSSMQKNRTSTKMTNYANENESSVDPLPSPLSPNDLHTGITNRMKRQSFRGNWPSSIDSPITLYRWLRARLAAGLVISSFDYLHRLLKRYYYDVNQVVRKLKNDTTQQNKLKSLRDRLAGIWCVYAHFTLEVGYLALTRDTEQKTPKVKSDFSLDEFSNLAISILLKAQDCPLVGNQATIGISLGRLIVSSTVMKESTHNCVREHLSRETLTKTVRSAMDACWDSIDVCRLQEHKTRRCATKPVSTKVILSLSNLVLTCDKTNLKKEAQINIWGGIASTLLLPMTLRDSLPNTSFLFKIDDRDAILYLCQELNRWSRLAEKLEFNLKDTIRIAPSCDTEISFAAEELPLYAPLEAASNPFNHYNDMVSPEKEIIWQW